MDKIIAWCGSNTTRAKVTRTIVQGALSCIVAYIPTWAGANLPPEVTATMIPAIMAVLAAAQAWIGSKGVYTGGDVDA